MEKNILMTLKKLIMILKKYFNLTCNSPWSCHGVTLFLSFPRPPAWRGLRPGGKRESSFFGNSWIPAPRLRHSWTSFAEPAPDLIRGMTDDLRTFLRYPAVLPRGASLVAAIFTIFFLLPSPSSGVQFSAGEGKDLVFNPNVALKASLLVPESDQALNLWRLRLGLDVKYRSQAKLGVAYEQRIRTNPGGNENVFAVLPPEMEAPYRLSQLDWSLAEKDGEYSYRHEIDRAFLALNLGRADLTFGRQAVGWGRGVIFSAVDVFSPFSPLEVDREWRRGVDAVRADLKISDRYSLDLVGAFGPEIDESAFLGRLRGYAGRLDGEFIFGRRARDLLYAVTLSGPLGGAEVHGELAFFDTPEEFSGGAFDRWDFAVAKSVLGASYTFKLGNGLSAWAEYHFSGFGFDNMSQAFRTLALEKNFRTRYLRGDTQILGKQALAFRWAYEFSDLLNASVSWIGSPTDGSGVVTPVLSSTFSDNLSTTLSAFFPYGAGWDGNGIPRSEYGSSPLTGFLQVNIYY